MLISLVFHDLSTVDIQPREVLCGPHHPFRLARSRSKLPAIPVAGAGSARNPSSCGQTLIARSINGSDPTVQDALRVCGQEVFGSGGLEIGHDGGH